MTSPQAPPSSRDAKNPRECTVCLTGTLACAHFAGRLVTLFSADDLPKELAHRAPCPVDPCASPFHVNSGPDGLIPCATCGVEGRIKVGKYTCHSDLASAEAEFARREQELLGR